MQLVPSCGKYEPNHEWFNFGLHLLSGFQWSFQTDPELLWFCVLTLSVIGWKKTRATYSTNHLVKRVSQRLAPATCIYSVFWLVHCVISVCCDSLFWLLWVFQQIFSTSFFDESMLALSFGWCYNKGIKEMASHWWTHYGHVHDAKGNHRNRITR